MHWQSNSASRGNGWELDWLDASWKISSRRTTRTQLPYQLIDFPERTTRLGQMLTKTDIFVNSWSLRFLRRSTSHALELKEKKDFVGGLLNSGWWEHYNNGTVKLLYSNHSPETWTSTRNLSSFWCDHGTHPKWKRLPKPKPCGFLECPFHCPLASSPNLALISFHHWLPWSFMYLQSHFHIRASFKSIDLIPNAPFKREFNIAPSYRVKPFCSLELPHKNWFRLH